MGMQRSHEAIFVVLAELREIFSSVAYAEARSSR